MEPTTSANMQLYEKLATLQHLLMRRRFAQKNIGPVADPMRGQGRILALLKIKDGVSTKDMSSVLGIRTSSLNELLSKLEAKGYIVREQSEEDRRVSVVKLTEKGREVEQPATGAATLDMFDCLSEDEKKAFGEYLDKMIAYVGSEIGRHGDEDFDAMLRKREKTFKKFFGEEGPFGDSGLFPPFGGFASRGGCGSFDPNEGEGCGGFDPHEGGHRSGFDPHEGGYRSGFGRRDGGRCGSEE